MKRLERNIFNHEFINNIHSGLNYELLIARRIAYAERKGNMIAKPIIRLALIGVALGFAVMVIALSIVTGFKKEISEKVIGFGSHIQISKYSENNSFETQAIQIDSSLVGSLKSNSEISHIQVFGTKAGILKSGDEIVGVVAKGIGPDFDWSFFNTKMVEGETFSLSDTGKTDKIILSSAIAHKLKLHHGDKVLMYFIQQPPRVRKFEIAGVYETGLEEFDNLYIICDINHIRKLNDWNNDEVGGIEISVKDFNNLSKVTDEVYNEISVDLNAKSIIEIYPQLFDWLGLQNINAVVIIFLMILVAAINMISALIIIILERVRFIGTIKSMGASNASVRKIFIYVASFLIWRGLIWGNVIGVGLCLLQQYFGIVKLDQASYYISQVPIDLSVLNLLILNIGTILICTLMMIVPTMMITRVSPLKALRFN
ncbi:MAG TPA: ABC transporter permease [Bacteroidia bacterium]|nr:ABC transporter permease [Bacteroidia bacterium]HNS12613.1 ABC transporter permease [Bacteroidia bacterium]